MASKKYLSDLYEFMTPELPGITQAFMLQALQKGARRFCSDTESWRETLDPAHNIVEDQLEYILDWDWCAELRRITELRLNTEANLDEGNKGVAIPESGYTFDLPDMITLDKSHTPAEDVTNGLEVDVIFVPLLSSCSIPEWYLNRWVDGILGWAMADLMNQPGKRWTNPARAVYYTQQFNDNVNLAKQEIQRTNQNADLRFGG